ncbi:NAD(P)-binding protein [Punctularia strigosozonata HHB-11173 SS5]|uniref:NAD(P)-binding protein n=1 Tax=Punctularia strigosozonata (strain HHB-11173) TaxID=741275 RepID=UPI0004416DF7|nr:NAD(P)-binding protein [Punctularia strigosozonata HHB-11173 SS5]EIN11460.1 NAD(P)-binding protein [Punctularia strigosozonata HHB-11173 SS5]
MADVTPAKQLFLSSPQFAVVGASKDQTKFGTKVLQWYQARSKPVTPVHPKEAELEGLPTVKSIAELPAPAETSISLVTPPKITLGIVQEAKKLNVPALWIQPGADDNSVRQWVEENGLSEKVVYGCVLVEGDRVLQSL